MQLLPNNLSIDFVGKRKFFVMGSLILNLLILAGIAVFSFNWGVDFAGGSEMEIKFSGPADATKIRKTMEAAGFHDASVQEIGRQEEHSFLIRTGKVALLTPEEAKKGEDALRSKLGDKLASFEYNPEQFGDRIELRFNQDRADEAQVKETLASAGISVREMNKVDRGFSVFTAGISDKVKSALGEATTKGELPSADVQRVEFVGPQVGKQLRNQGILSVLVAAFFILVYIALRFDTRFAPGAVIAMFHDIVVVLGYFLVTRREFSLTSVAVLLTVVGYSVNDTIVVYDRIRENVAKLKGMALPALINVSINETLSRTVLTSLTTVLALVGLLLFGVGQIWDFAAAMLLGIIVGTYSSIYIASPTTIWLEELWAKKAAENKAAVAG